MRKQTKLVAVLSAAALLAIGASMTSFAASGKWVEENGTWVYYNRSGEKVTEEWAKSGDYWYWLNEDGEMATDTLVEDDENHYYVNENGTMVQNRWIAVENEDYDGSDDEEPMNYWYYFGSNGKAYKSGTNSNNASFKTINGKKYIFDDEGRMLYGWINTEGERETGDDAWQHADYYCGGENDGAQKAGEWAYLDIIDDGYDDDVAGQSSKNLFDDEDQTRWFYFKTNGKKIVGKKGETINGRKYSFDDYGRMNAEWVYYKNGDTSVATPTTATTVQGTKDYTTGFRYYGDPESGARKTKGWFQVVPDENLQADKYNDDEDFWYYSDKDGKLVASEMKMYHKLLRYGGTIDLLCILGDELALVDFKTTYSLLEMTCGVQLEAYSQALASHGLQIQRKHILHMKKDGKWAFPEFPAKDPTRWRVVGALKSLYDYEQSYK